MREQYIEADLQPQIGTAREEVEKVHGKPERQELYARGQDQESRGQAGSPESYELRDQQPTRLVRLGAGDSIVLCPVISPAARGSCASAWQSGAGLLQRTRP